MQKAQGHFENMLYLEYPLLIQSVFTMNSAKALLSTFGSPLGEQQWNPLPTYGQKVSKSHLQRMTQILRPKLFPFLQERICLLRWCWVAFPVATHNEFAWGHCIKKYGNEIGTSSYIFHLLFSWMAGCEKHWQLGMLLWNRSLAIRLSHSKQCKSPLPVIDL